MLAFGERYGLLFFGREKINFIFTTRSMSLRLNPSLSARQSFFVLLAGDVVGVSKLASDIKLECHKF